MLPQSPLEYALWGGLIIAGWVLGYFGSTFEGKWRRRFHDERRFYAQYRDETDRLNIEKTRRIAELEAQKNALSQEVVRLREDAAALAARAAPPPSEPVIDAAPLSLTAEPVAEILHEPVPAPVPETPPAEHHEAAPEPMAAAHEHAPTAEPEPPVHDAPPPEEPAPALPLMAATAAPIAAAAITHPDILPHIETVADAPAPADMAPDHAGTTVFAPAHHAPVEAEHAAIPMTDPDAETGVEEDHEPVQIDAVLHGLTRIRGIDETLAAGLGSLGVRQITDIERLSAEDEKAIEIQLNLPPGQIATQQWRLQAALIGSGEDELIEA